MWLRVAKVLASIAVVLGVVVAATGVMVVDVKKPDGTRLVVPMPLLLVQAAAPLAPTQAAAAGIERQVARVRRYLPAAEEVLAAVAGSRDSDLARVDKGDEHVRVRKVGDSLHIRVESPRKKVELNVPFELARRALDRARDGPLSPADLVALLRHSRLTQLADVDDGGDHVKITIW